MKAICCYCGIQYGEKDPVEDQSETHGICPDCYPSVMADLERQLKEMEKDYESQRMVETPYR